MTTPHEPDYTALFKAYLIEPKDNLRAKLIQAVSYHEGWEESAVCMVDEAIMPVFTALLSDSATVERVAERIWAKDYPKGGSMIKAYSDLDHRNKELYRADAQAAIQAIKEMVG